MDILAEGPAAVVAPVILGKQEQLLSLESLAIAPPFTTQASGSSSISDETSSILSSSSESNIDSGTFLSSGSYACSSISLNNGQLTPPFSLSSNSSSLDIADHAHNIDIACSSTSATAAAADRQEERVNNGAVEAPRGSRRKSRQHSLNVERVARSEVRRYAAEIVRKEAKALLDLAARLDPESSHNGGQPEDEQAAPRLKPAKAQDSFSKAIEILRSMDSHGRIIMTGVGKSGLLARKAVATFNSFGIPSAFLHPVEALHGDLGLLSPYGVDTVILISYSGRTSELLHLLQHLRRRRIHSCISLSSPDSALAEACDVNIDVSLENDEEAEDSVPAPTSSVLTALAALDALALTLLRLKTGWNAHVSERRKAFGLHHPGGSLGQQLSSSTNEQS